MLWICTNSKFQHHNISFQRDECKVNWAKIQLHVTYSDLLEILLIRFQRGWWQKTCDINILSMYTIGQINLWNLNVQFDCVQQLEIDRRSSHSCYKNKHDAHTTLNSQSTFPDSNQSSMISNQLLMQKFNPISSLNQTQQDITINPIYCMMIFRHCDWPVTSQHDRPTERWTIAKLEHSIGIKMSWEWFHPWKVKNDDGSLKITFSDLSSGWRC